MRLTTALLTVALLGVLGACGDDTSETAADPSSSDSASTAPSETGSPSASETPVPDGPACADLWVDGETIPAKYQGCDDDGLWVPAERTRCDSGQVIITYGDQFYGVLGNRVNDTGGSLADSSAYRRAARSCG